MFTLHFTPTARDSRIFKNASDEPETHPFCLLLFLLLPSPSLQNEWQGVQLLKVHLKYESSLSNCVVHV